MQLQGIMWSLNKLNKKNVIEQKKNVSQFCCSDNSHVRAVNRSVTVGSKSKGAKRKQILNSKTSILKFGPSNLDLTILIHTLTVWMRGICDCSKSKSDYFGSKKLYLQETNVKSFSKSDYTIPIFFQLFPLYFFTAAIKSLSCK